AGYVDFGVNDTIVSGKKHLHFHGYGSSYSNWDWFYKVRSNYESFASLDLKSERFIRLGTEGKHYYNRDYHVKGDTIYTTFKDKNGEANYTKLYSPEPALDVISAIYYCRTLDFNSYSVGEKIPLTFYLDGSIYPSYLRFLGSETWTHPKNKTDHQCWVFKPLLIEGTVFKEGENMTVYVSKDEKKIPLYIETDLAIGKAKVFLID
ncbi:MAG: DUF3108 domain-containing protein, partial [Flavobacteriales bacterium]